MVQLGCNFEIDTCVWIDTAPDGYSWTRASGSTPSLRTNPSEDHTTGLGYYIYTESYGSSRLHQLESPLFSLQQDATLSFFYHMYGYNMGTLSVEAYSETDWLTLWSESGDQGDSWHGAAVVLPASTTQVRFSGETGPNSKSNMALDDVSFSQIAPPSLPPSPPSSPGVPPGFVAAVSEAGLRSLIENATADISIFLAPDVHLNLSKEIHCASNVRVIVASSGKGATLDGKGKTNLFLLRRRCSLTLRWLTLVNGGAYYGGAVYAYGAGNVEIIGSTVTNCSAAVGVVVTAAAGAGSVDIIDSAVTGCTAGMGVVVYMTSSGAVSLIRSNVTGCSASSADGGVIAAHYSGDVSLIDSTMTDCSTGNDGGVVYAKDSGAVSLVNSKVMGCSAGRSGGVVYTRGSGDVSLNNSNVTSCSANGDGRMQDWGSLSGEGGVVYAAQITGAVSLTNSTVAGCSAWVGGAAFLRSANLNVADSTISGCNATRGGAVYLAPSYTEVKGSASLARSTISNCIAIESGGGLYSAGGRTALSDGTLISGCSAPEGQGSSIFLLAGEVTYTLPAPAGRWLPNARCEVYRKACPMDSKGNPTNDCPGHREDCAINLVVQNQLEDQNAALREASLPPVSLDVLSTACRQRHADPVGRVEYRPLLLTQPSGVSWLWSQTHWCPSQRPQEVMRVDGSASPTMHNAMVNA